MDLEAVFSMADNISRTVTGPLGFHVTNEQFLDVDFSFVRATVASVKRTETSGTSHEQLSNPSGLIDSDDDFGDFTSVPADPAHGTDARAAPLVFPVNTSAPLVFPVNTTVELDVGGSLDMFGFHTTSLHPQMSPAQEDLFGDLSATIGSPADKARSELAASPVKTLESTSDDDWGDFVEHSTSAIWDNSQAFDWFDTSQQNVGQILPTESATSTVNDSLVNVSAWETGFGTEPSKVGIRPSEQNTTNFAFNDLGVFAGRNISSSEGSKNLLPQSHDAEGFTLSDNETATQLKTSALQRTLSGQNMVIGMKVTSNVVNSAPIPLSLFSDNELEVETSKTELADPVTRPFQGHSRSKARSTGSDGKNLSDIIASLYAETQSDSQSKALPIMTNVDLNEIKSSVKSNDNLFDVAVIGKDGVPDGTSYGYRGSTGFGSSSLEECMFSLTLDLKHVEDPKGSAGAKLQSQDATTYVLFGSASMADQCSFVKAWASILAVCASELERALNIWKEAQNADVHLALLADLQGKRYFAAIGQVYVVALTLATTSNFYKPWLSVASKEGESLLADLARCKAAWLQSNLKEGVRLALDGLEDLVPSSVLSWKGIEGFAAVAREAYLQAGSASLQSICKMSLLPLTPFSDKGLLPVQWSGSSYILPLANMWVNCVSQEPLSTSLSTLSKTL